MGQSAQQLQLRTATFEDRLNYNDGTSPQNGRLRYAVGNSQVRKYEFTDNGQRLTTFTPSLSDTPVRSRQHWRRIL